MAEKDKDNIVIHKQMQKDFLSYHQNIDRKLNIINVTNPIENDITCNNIYKKICNNFIKQIQFKDRKQTLKNECLLQE